MPFDPSSATPLDAPSAPAPAGFDPSSARIFDPSTATAAPEGPPRAGAADVGHGIGAGLMRGAGAVLGMPSDLWQMLDRGYQNLLTRSAEKMGILTPEQGAKLRQPIPGAEDYEAGSTKINQHLMDLAAKAGADTSEPTTKAGQVAENVASFLPGAVSLGAGAVKEIPRAAVRYGLLPGAASEVAGQATQGTAAEPYARLAGALGPEALIQGSRLATRAMDPMRGLIEGASPQQLQAAQRILEESRTAGAPLTVPEAIQTATGNGTRVGDLQRVVEQSERGAETMRPFMAQRPGQTEALGRGVLGEISPAAADPYAIAPRIQGAAQRVLDTSPEATGLERSVTALGPPTTAEEAGNVIQPELRGVYEHREGMRNALADQDYAAARAADYGPNGEAANPVRIQPVIDNIDDLLTSAKGGVARALRTARQALLSNGQPDMSVRGLSNARNAISDQISSATRVGNNQVASALQNIQGQLDYALERVPEFGQARRNFARASEPLAPFADNTAPGRIIDRDQFNRGFTMPAERVAPTIERGGPSAADQFLAAAENSPASRQAFGQYYSRQLLGSATDATGRINPDILANTLRDNQDMLQRFPEIANNLNQVGTARRALQQLEQTPTGALAATVGRTGQEQFTAQRNLLFAPNPLAGGERTIANTVRAIAEHDPVAAQQFVRQHLEQAFNEATQNNLPGANQFGGPKFTAVVAGNSQQAKNLEAAVRALPNGDLRWNALRKGLDIMEAMGTRQPVGSQTAFNAQIQKWLQQGNPASEFLVQAASPGRWPGLVDRIYRHVVFNRNTGELARLFTTGNVKDLQAIASSGQSTRGQMALIGALGRQGFLSTPQNGSPPQ